MINMMRDKSADEVIKWKFLNRFTNGDTEALRPMIESLVEVAPYLTKESIKNETECCYTFDFPQFSGEMQKKHIRPVINLLRSIILMQKMTVLDGYAHMTYSARHTQEYLELIKTELDFIEKAAKR